MSNLDLFIDGYIAAVDFIGISDEDRGLALSAEALAVIEEECALFLNGETEALIEAAREIRPDYGWDSAGSDFYFTRNHAGVGYWDRGLGKVGDALSDFAHAAGTADIIRNDADELDHV